jgi:5-methylcytosine-specific restriction protein B
MDNEYLELENKLKQSAEKLLKIYENKNDEEKRKYLEDKNYVLNKWQPIFDINNINNLTPDDLINFAEFKENRHWKHILRNKKKVLENFETNKEAIRILVDQNQGPCKERLKKAYDKAKNLGSAFLTAILFLEYPEECSVSNNKSYKALKNLKLIDFQYNEDNLIKNYKITNDLTLKLKDLTNLDLWTLDFLFCEITEIQSEKDQMNNKSNYWIEIKHPKKNEEYKAGVNLYSSIVGKNKKDYWKNMDLVQKDDIIIHLIIKQTQNDRSIVGISKVKNEVEKNEINNERKIILYGYIDLKMPIKWEEFKSKYRDKLLEIRNKYRGKIFYNKNLDINREYLINVPGELMSLFNEFYLNKTGENLPYFNIILKTHNDIDIPKNIILHGPVGTGKTTLARFIASKIIKKEIQNINDLENTIEEFEKGNINGLEGIIDINNPQIKFITFHQNYGYEDFIIGIKASTKDGNIYYDVTPGIFKKFCDEANKNKKNNYVLIIDEINRGDISRIFGELISLIEADKRDGSENKIEVTLPYSNQTFSVPNNIYIIGTMNDTDRSIALLDVALRRRFKFFKILPNKEIIKKWAGEDDNGLITNVFSEINSRIKSIKGEDWQIGHAFFKDINDPSVDKIEMLQKIFKYSIIPLLMEYFYGDMETLITGILKDYKFFKENNYELDYTIFKPENKENFKKVLEKNKPNEEK